MIFTATSTSTRAIPECVYRNEQCCAELKWQTVTALILSKLQPQYPAVSSSSWSIGRIRSSMCIARVSVVIDP